MGLYEQWASESAADWVVIPSKVKLQAIEPAKDIEKANPYHDKFGRFTFAPGGGAGSTLAPKALAKCKEVEAASVKLSNEQLTAIDDDGNIVFQKEGNRAHVSLGYEDRMKADGKILTHNHPGEYGGTFSEGDIGTFLGVYAKSIRAVGAEGTYSIERGKAEYEEVYSFAQASVKELRGIGAQFAKARDGKMADVDAGKISEGDADKELGALRKELLSSMSTKFEQLAKQNNLIYTFEPSGKVEKFNPYHDRLGRFASASGAASNGKGFKGTLYHGSPAKDIEEFDMSRAGKNTSSGEKLLYFTDSKQMAEDFSYERLEGSSKYTQRRGEKGRVYEVDVEIKNPLDFRNLSDKDIENILKLDVEGLLTKELVQSMANNHQLLKASLDLRAESLIKLGYDGMIANTGKAGHNSLEYAVVDAKQAKIKKSVEDVEKANPYHDPKTGRFTNKPGGAGSKFVRPQPPDDYDASPRREGESREEAIARRQKWVDDYDRYEREMDEVFGEVDKRIGDILGIPSYNVGLREVLDPDEISTLAGEMELFVEKFPQVKGAIKKLDCYDFTKVDGQHRENVIGYFDKRDKRIALNSRYYKNNQEELKASHAKDIEANFHPQGTTPSVYLHHEMAHALDDYVSYRKINKEISAVNFKAELDRGQESGEPHTVASITNELSRYATVNHEEFFAEAISEYVNSPNPRPMATRVGERTKFYVE